MTHSLYDIFFPVSTTLSYSVLPTALTHSYSVLPTALTHSYSVPPTALTHNITPHSHLHIVTVSTPFLFTAASNSVRTYRGANKSLARPGRKQARATDDFDFYIPYLKSQLE